MHVNIDRLKSLDDLEKALEGTNTRFTSDALEKAKKSFYIGRYWRIALAESQIHKKIKKMMKRELLKKFPRVLLTKTLLQEFLLKTNPSNHSKKKLLNLYIDKIKDINAKRNTLNIHWKHIYKRAVLNTGKNEFLCTKDLKALKQEINQVVLAVETNGMTLFKNPNYVKGEDQKNVMTWLSSHLPLRPNILSWNGIRNLRINLDPAFAESFRNQFQEAFLKLYKQMQTKKHDPLVEKMILDQLLSLYTYSEPLTGSSIKIPQIHGREKLLVEYSLKREPLSDPVWGGTVDAYILEPLEQTEKAHPYILFRGTTYPSAPGSLLARASDFIPGKAVGEILFKMGKGKIEEIVKELNKKYPKKTHACGQSLGGALSYYTAFNFPNEVDFHSTAPAGVHTKHINTAKAQKSAGVSYRHQNDFVPLVGVHPEGKDKEQVEVIEGKQRGYIDAHACLYGTRKNTVLLKINTKVDNQSSLRKAMTIGHQVLSVPFLFMNGIGLLITHTWNNIKYPKIFKKNPFAHLLCII